MLPVCPKCDTALIVLRFRSIEVDYCEQCGGLWFDSGELEQLLADTGARGDDPWFKQLTEVSPAAPKTRYLCPRCDQRLRETCVPNGPRLDVCPQRHGLWFDAGELRQILSLAPEGTGAERTIQFLNEVFSAEVKPEKEPTR